VWEVETTDEFRDWYEELDATSQAPIMAAVERLEQQGPTLGRPVVGEIAGLQIHNLKELRPLGTSIRILFVFDPRRAAILLIGADKADHGWTAWYPGAITEAERLYGEYLDELRKEGLLE
jgi:hypothetical protein